MKIKEIIDTIHTVKIREFFWLALIYGISTIVEYLMPNQLYTYKQFFFKQFSLP